MNPADLILTILIADLFAGAGGASLGAALACEDLGHDYLIEAANHWERAVETHQKNFPGHIHYCQDVDKVDPIEAVPGGYLDILLAGPECTGFSRASGGKSKKRQNRSSAFDIMHWLEVIYTQTVIIENVREFLDWGPLYPPDYHIIGLRNKPIPHLKGRDFRLFIGGLEELGYTVEWRLLKSCDYGDPTSRERLFIQATRKGRPQWPVPTHCAPKVLAAYPSRQPYRTAREIIDWSIKGISIYDRAAHGLPELCANTLRRIYTGMRKLSGLPFIVQMANASEGDARRCYDLDRSLTTVTTKASHGLVQPLLVVFRNNCNGASLDNPLAAVCTSRGHFALLEPITFLTAAKNEAKGQSPRVHSLDQPLPTVLAQGRPGDLCEAFLTRYHGGHDAIGLDVPLPTVTANYEHFALTEAVLPSFLVRYNGGNRSQSLDTPITTLDTSNRFALCQFVVQYNGNSTALSIANPLGTVTCNDRFGLVELVVVGEENGQTVAEGKIVGWLDILFRMLQPHELALAQGFPKSYHFCGSREEVVAQIGNAWSGNLARALCRAALSRPGALLRSPTGETPDFSGLHTYRREHQGLRTRLLTASKDYEIVGPDLFTQEGLTA